MLTLTACQTTRLSVPVNLETICLALTKADPLEYANEADKRLIREQFSARGRLGQKSALALRKALGCPA